SGAVLGVRTMQTLIVALAAAKILFAQVMVLGNDHSHRQSRANAEWQFARSHDHPYEEFFSEPGLPLAYANLEHYASTLDLTQEQRDFIKDRYKALIVGYMERWVDLAERRTDARFLAIPSAEAEYSDAETIMRSRLRQFRVEEQRLAQEIRKALLDDLQLILTPEQRDRWSIYERESLRRETLAKYAIFDDERYDLIEITEKLDLSSEDREKIADILEEYAQAIHPLITMRNARIDAVASVHDEFMNELDRFNKAYSELTPNDQERGRQLARQYVERRREIAQSLTTEAVAARRASERLRDTNIRFRNDLLNILPEPTHKALTPKGRPQTTRAVVDFSHSRAEQLLSVLMNAEAATLILESSISMYALDPNMSQSEISGMREWLLLVRSADPITNDQRRQLRRIEDRRQQRREAVLARDSSLRNRVDNRPNPDITFSIPTPHGRLVFRRGGSAPQLSEREQARMQEIRTQLHRIEQDAVDEIRAILTARQRMAVATF
ncbi:MAG: hypothetical protein EA380_00155, partial [Phycisphaeraceae bacterium]